MRGRRIPDNQYPFLPGDYGKVDGCWHCFPPNFDGLGNLGHHTVTENADGTITVEPSILISNHLGSWHGYLTDGIWREC